VSLNAPEVTSAIPRSTVPGWHGRRRGALVLDRVIGVGCEAAGAMLVLAEVFILFSGAVSR
jgi:hypothetical protein